MPLHTALCKHMRYICGLRIRSHCRLGARRQRLKAFCEGPSVQVFRRTRRDVLINGLVGGALRRRGYQLPPSRIGARRHGCKPLRQNFDSVGAHPCLAQTVRRPNQQCYAWCSLSCENPPPTGVTPERTPFRRSSWHQRVGPLATLSWQRRAARNQTGFNGVLCEHTGGNDGVQTYALGGHRSEQPPQATWSSRGGSAMRCPSQRLGALCSTNPWLTTARFEPKALRTGASSSRNGSLDQAVVTTCRGARGGN